ncbi:hypothetical protein FQN51_001419 [Onygenales sp. PD_10]|nr:hypothetical protein FQN51_001419 [Onygenales sp. PD_10]
MERRSTSIHSQRTESSTQSGRATIGDSEPRSPDSPGFNHRGFRAEGVPLMDQSLLQCIGGAFEHSEFPDIYPDHLSLRSSPSAEGTNNRETPSRDTPGSDGTFQRNQPNQGPMPTGQPDRPRTNSPLPARGLQSPVQVNGIVNRDDDRSQLGGGRQGRSTPPVQGMNGNNLPANPTANGVTFEINSNGSYDGQRANEPRSHGQYQGQRRH